MSAVAVNQQNFRTRLAGLGLRELTLIPALILIGFVGWLNNPAFLTADNIVNILQQSSELSILVIAETLILLLAKIDLSLESIVGFAPMLGAWLIATDPSLGGSGIGLNPALAIALVFVTGAAVGAINGFLVVTMRLSPFIVTLSILILLRGMTLGLTNGTTLFDLPDSFLYLGNAKWAGVPASIWIAALLYLVFGIVLRYHRLGRALYAIGGNPEAARVAGIQVDRIVWGTYIVAGLLAALAGLMLSGRIASVVSSQGQNMIFYVFAASVIGGVNLNGGRGRLIGALTGVLLLGVLQNVLTLSQVPSFWIDAVYGAIILLALIFARLTGDRSADN
ncbi:ABC transporter permease [Mesorhizobium sp. BH1-1-5]|uniref:ABC transporter permease n=1 Tax=unclassified Mesorhizobium TaxID=325217 RepID=UPI00112B5CDF|nr:MULTISPECIES: ABC transporter permease [unclassified Mesorhizobium]MBZ9990190.1 ABC transporter permease [Mesorhizobium sp. BH1-1-5]TPJ60461.1 ABC transporter permease [Mesorhizobium sp. B2-7-1]